MRYKSVTIKGAGRGKTLGFPTINLALPESFDIEQGIYAAIVSIGRTEHKGALYFGPIPTFGDKTFHIEIYLIDVPDITVEEGEPVIFEPAVFIRGVEHFDDPQELVAQMTQDVLDIRDVFDTYDKENKE